MRNSLEAFNLADLSERGVLGDDLAAVDLPFGELVVLSDLL